MSAFSRRLAELIRERGVSNYQLAKDTGISASFLGRLVSGERGPSLAMAETLAVYFDVSLDEFRAKKTSKKS